MFRLRAADRDCQGAPLPDQHDQLLAAGHAGIGEVALQHRVVLGRQRYHHRRIFRALAFVDRCRIGERQLVEIAGAVADPPAVKVDLQLAGGGIEPGDDAEIAVIDVLVVIVFDLGSVSV